MISSERQIEHRNSFFHEIYFSRAFLNIEFRGKALFWLGDFIKFTNSLKTKNTKFKIKIVEHRMLRFYVKRETAQIAK